MVHIGTCETEKLAKLNGSRNPKIRDKAGETSTKESSQNHEFHETMRLRDHTVHETSVEERLQNHEFRKQTLSRMNWL